MADEIAESSTAVAEPTPAESSPAAPVETSSEERLTRLSGTEYDEWLKSGNLPEETPSTPAESAPVDPKQPVNTPESGTGKNLKTRLPQLDAEIAELKQRLEIKKQLQEQLGERRPSEKPKEPAAEKPKRPSISDPDFKTFEEYEEALSTYLLNEAEQRADQRYGERSAKEREQAARDTALANTRAAFEQSAKEAEQVYPDYKEVIQHLRADPLPEQGEAMTEFMLAGSEFLPHMVRHFALNRAEYDRINGLASLPAMRELVALENKIRDEVRVVKGNGVKKVSTSPPAPKTVSGHAVAPEDETADAIEKNDYSRFEAIANAAELKRRGIR